MQIKIDPFPLSLSFSNSGITDKIALLFKLQIGLVRQILPQLKLSINQRQMKHGK